MVDRNQPARVIDRPEPCFIRLRIIRNGPFLAARIFHRFGVLCAEINGVPADPCQVWHGGDLITEADYLRMMETPEPDPLRQTYVSNAGLSDRVREQDEADYWMTQPIR